MKSSQVFYVPCRIPQTVRIIPVTKLKQVSLLESSNTLHTFLILNYHLVYLQLI